MSVTRARGDFISCRARNGAADECLRALRPLIDLARGDREALIALLECLPYTSSKGLGRERQDRALRSAIVEQLGDHVSAMAQLLELDVDRTSSDRDWNLVCAQDHACRVLAEMGPVASAAIPALVSHAKRYPRVEINVMAIGKIGNRAVVRQLVEWTNFQGSRGDRKRTDSACGAIRDLGEEGIVGLLELAESDDDHERVSALLNLLDNTAFPSDKVMTMIAKELERTRNIQCREILERALAR